jgi:hypothetical protein
MRPVQMTGDGKQPCRQPGFRPERSHVSHQPEPRFVEQILGDSPAPTEAEQKRKQTRAVELVDAAERGRVPAAEACHERGFVLRFHL